MVKKVFSFVSILAMVLLALGSVGNTAAAAQTGPAPIRLVRTLGAEETGVANPVGIAYSLLGDRYHLVSAYEQGQRLPAYLDVQQLDRLADPEGSTLLKTAVGDPMNITFDNRAGRLLLYQSSSSSLLAVRQDSAGNLLSTSQTAYDFRRFDLQSVQGLSFDDASGALYILDSAAQQILRIEPDSSGSFASSSAVETDLSTLGAADLRGLAVDPLSGNLFVVDPEELMLYELAADGELVSQRDLSTFGVQNPQGMTFAPSGDQTDDPDETSLYLTDSGLTSGGRILEFSLTEIPAIQQFAFVSALVATRDLSTITPPSPDAVGIAYHSGNDTLLITDSEVEEAASSAYWNNVNFWELSLDAATVLATGNTSNKQVIMKPFSDEPTDVAHNPDNQHYYFSDDNLDNISDLDPGVDATMWTVDDVVTSFSVTPGSGDPEGIAFGGGYLFVADGINSEIYKYNLSGVLLDQFDTEAMGVVNPNAVEYNTLSDTLLILSNNGDEVIAETTTSGALLRTIDVSSIPLVSPDGLTYAPPTDGDTLYHYYIADRGIDNDTDPTPDAKIFEITAPPPITPGNEPLIVNAGSDQNITLPTNLINLDGTVTDDGIPGLGVTSLWTVASGACGVTFGDPTAVDTTATFTYGGSYELQLEATDTELNVWDSLMVKVNRANPTMVFDSYVEAKWDDAEERADGTIGREGTTIELGEHLTNGAQTDGFRFNWLDIPQGATIVNAYIQFTAHDEDTSVANLLIKGEASDDAATFLNVDDDISSRPTTTASVAWNPSQWNTINQRGIDQRTPDLAPILQEIVNRAGWQSGNSAAFIITGTGTRRAYGYEGNPCDAAMLHVEWEIVTNLPPVAVDDLATVAEDSIDNIIDVLSNDTDPDGDTLSVSAVGTASHGTVTLDAGVVKYTPTANYFGPDSFTYTVSDGLLTDEGLVNITVTNVNDPPVAVDDLATVAEDSVDNVIVVLTNDTDIDTGDTLSVSAVGTASHGTVTLDAGVVKYTPTTDYFGPDSFTYTVSDGLLTDEGLVNITVTNVNDPPVAVDDLATVAEDSVDNIIDVLTNDTDIDTGDILTVTAVGTASHGTVTLTAGVVKYTPTPNYFGTDSFTYTVSDGLLTDEGLVNITVTPVSDPPLAVDDLATVAEDSVDNIIAVLTNDTDPDGDSLSISAVGTASHGTVTLDAGVVKYTPTTDYFGPDSFTYTVSDGLLTDEGLVSITVTNVNDAPVAVDDSATVAEDSIDNIIAVLTNDTDIDTGDILTVTAVGTASHGTVTLTAGVVKYTPTPNYFGPDSFTYTVSDGLLTDEGLASITVTNVNDPPVAVDDEVSVAKNSTDNVIDVLANDTDLDGDTLSVVAVSTASNGTVTLTAGVVKYTPDTGFVGIDNFTYTVSDGTVTDEGNVTITVGTNHPPVAVADFYTVLINRTLNVLSAEGVLKNDTDEDGHSLTAILVSAPAHHDGVFTLNSDGSFTYIPAAGFYGTDTFTYMVNDGLVDSNVVTVTISVRLPLFLPLVLR